jgi:hypothetical protein
MNPRSTTSRCRITTLAFALSVAAVCTASAPPQNMSAPAAKEPQAAQTNNVPESVFLIPSNRSEGRDPFFPHSTRPLSGAVVAKATAPVAPINLELKALFGTPDRRMAMINNRNFEIGEEQEIPTPGGRVRVRCLEIHEDSVVIEASGVRRILRLRTGVL